MASTNSSGRSSIVDGRVAFFVSVACVFAKKSLSLCLSTPATAATTRQKANGLPNRNNVGRYARRFGWVAQDSVGHWEAGRLRLARFFCPTFLVGISFRKSHWRLLFIKKRLR
nr:hypothetical protein [Pandoravirus aubagnensis]